MVVASILGLSLSFIPCLMIGFIMLISFLLCNCEYIGETVAKHFCAWKNRRKGRNVDMLDPSSNENNGRGRSRKHRRGLRLGGSNESFEVDQTYSYTRFPSSDSLSLLNRGHHLALEEVEVASAPSLSPSHSIQNALTYREEDFNDSDDWQSREDLNSNSTNRTGQEGTNEDTLFDPPPTYEQCLRDKYEYSLDS